MQISRGPLALVAAGSALAALLAPLASEAQYAKFMRSGRPGQSMGSYCAGEGVLQLQQGLTFQDVRLDGADVLRITNNNVIRYGVTRDFEVSAVVAFQRRDRTGLDGGGQPASAEDFGVSGTQVGFRYNVLSETERLPSIAVQTRFLLRAQSEPFRRAGTGATTIIAVSKSLGGSFGALTNFGFTHAGGTETGLDAFYTAVLAYGIGRKLNAFVEGYGRFDGFDLNVDGGLGYFVNPDLKLDVFAGLQGFGDFEGDLPAVRDDYFVSFGVSWRVGNVDRGE